MTTDQEEQALLFPSEAYYQFQIPGRDYSVIRVPFYCDSVEYAVEVAGRLSRLLDEEFGASAPPVQVAQRQAQRPQQRPQGRPQQGQPQGRAGQYQQVQGESCDLCGGPAGLYPQRGSMPGDKLVCLSRCNDTGRDGKTYIHTIKMPYEAAAGYVEPDALPF